MLGPALKFIDGNHVLFNGEKLLFFGGTDYHGLSNYHLIKSAISDSVKKYGLSSTGSRVTTGNHPLYLELEQKLANFLGTESAVVCSSGYLSDIILLQAIGKDFDILLIDKLAHSSIVDAAKQCVKKIVFYQHVEAQSLADQLTKHLKLSSKFLIMTDGVFPSRGEIPPLKEYLEIIGKYDGRILVDDAHAMAVVGKTGKGSWEEEGIERKVVYQTGTMSKGFGVFGGIISGDYGLMNRIYKHSLAFIGSTGLAIPIVSAAIQSVSFIQSHLNIIKDLQEKSLLIKKKIKQLGLDTPQSPTPIVSITHYDDVKNKRLYQLLLKNGIYPPFVKYPGAPSGGHFRFALSNLHTQEQIDLLYETIESSL